MSPRASREPAGAGRSSAEALLRPRGRLGLAAPAYDGRSLPNITRSILEAVGGTASPLALPTLAPDLDPFAGRRAEGPVLLFVVDGLGYPRLKSAAARSPSGHTSRWFAASKPVTTVFPSTTTVALASLSTASAPSRHGLVGYREYLPAFGAVVDMLRMSPQGVAAEDALVGPGWEPSLVLAAPTIFRGLRSHAVAVSRDRFEGRAFTRLLYDGADYAPYAGYADFAAELVHQLQREPPPQLIFAYWDELDAVQHLRGPGDPAAGLEIERLGALLQFVAASVGPRLASSTRVLVTADHGLVPVDPKRQVRFDQVPEIASCLARPPTGDRRVGLLRARAGALDRLERALVGTMPEGTRSIPVAEALGEGLFGPEPYHPELIERLGDLVVLVPSPGGITYTPPGRSPRPRELTGAHGGLEPDELLVPLIAGSLADLGGPGPAP